MPELKTLKVIFDEPLTGDDRTLTDRSKMEKLLRQEAIKWIKEEITIKINERLPAPDYELQLIGLAALKHPETKRWMKRFNLMEDNLK